MNGRHPLTTRRYGIDFLRNRHISVVFASIIGLILMLFWISAETAQAGSCDSSYTVRSGDTMRRIASNHQTSPSNIRACNNLRTNTVRRGETLQLPNNAGSSADNGIRDSRNSRSGPSGGTSSGSGNSATPSRSSGNSSSESNFSPSQSTDSGSRNKNVAKRKKS